ncbi:hypothetical protein N7466_010119 [Penicillium verhagenii]|uniref:uncharacterized protein n=1 Tax=Penicillium verhagenii TaxID=1562060 RepID=UPI002545A639|nr:uncharacterized protein N7466_010119 [Penicillium verhagenii]KAJ5919176.1 hypothetical protein N7466_010119 [Penicillium verhagenii]
MSFPVQYYRPHSAVLEELKLAPTLAAARALRTADRPHYGGANGPWIDGVPGSGSTLLCTRYKITSR